MPKRKRPEPSPTPSDDSAPTDRKLSRQKKLCSQRIAAAQKPIVAALRLGAGFERQKHSRRKKTAQQKNDTKAVERLGAEYAVLKGLDIPKLAEQHLRKTIAKVKSLREHEAIPQSAKEIEKGAGEKDSATLNVTARLWKVAAVKNSVDEVINDLKIIVGAGDAATKTTSGKAKETSSKKKKAKIQEEEDESAEEFSDGDDDIYAAYSARIAAPSSGDEDSDASISEDDRPPSIIDSEGEHDPDADLEAASEPSESDSFHHFSSEGEDEENDSGIIEDSDAAEYSESESDSESIPIPKAKDKAPKTAKPSTSTFLPSLSHAAYFSGSESEASDLDNTDFAPRKNRRGQRARQKIAEQKYGEKAKHLQKEERNKGWDAKRGAVSDDRGRKGGKGGSGKGGKGGAPRGMKTGYGPERSGENAVPLGQRKTKRDDVGQLHPSWQAAKAAKEKKLDMKPQGKKVVFD